MKPRRSAAVDFSDEKVRTEILIRQRRDMWTPEQVASLARHFRLAPGQSFLDAGCGYGYSLRTFGRYCMPGGRLTGVDRDASLLDTAAELAREEGLGDAATFRAADLMALPFATGTFDVVMAQVVLCHLTDPEGALDEMIRVARPGGCIAIFDNAVGPGDWGRGNTRPWTLSRALLHAEIALRAWRGRRKLGRGDFSVGLHLPRWMEARGLDDVDVRANERVDWIAPPYRSPAQQRALTGARERCRERRFEEARLEDLRDELRATGADDSLIQRALRSLRREIRAFCREMDDGTASFIYGGTFWCVWGFKPGGREPRR